MCNPCAMLREPLTISFCASRMAPSTCAPLPCAAASLKPSLRASKTAACAAALAAAEFTAAQRTKKNVQLLWLLLNLRLHKGQRKMRSCFGCCWIYDCTKDKGKRAAAWLLLNLRLHKRQRNMRSCFGCCWIYAFTKDKGKCAAASAAAEFMTAQKTREDAIMRRVDQHC